MLVTYTAPNRAHHYGYATALAQAGCLKAFVTGFSRFSPRAALPEIGDKLVRADHIQNFYLASQRLHLPAAVTDELAYWSKIWLDWASAKYARESTAFLFYNGAGLHTAKKVKSSGAVTIVEAVNSHVLVQEKILREEFENLGLSFRRFHSREVARRVSEYAIADAVLCPSSFVKRSFLEQGFPENRLLTVPYGFSPHTSSIAPTKNSDAFRVLYVGQISIRKGLRYLFKAFSKVNHPNKELWIVGPRARISGIDDIAPPPGTKFLGILKGQDLASAYRDSTVFVLPTVEDGQALVLGEALSFGLPVIATINSGGLDLYQQGVEGFHIPIRDSAAIEEKLQLLADNPSLRVEMSDAAIRKSQRLGGWSKSGAMLVEALASISPKT